LCHFFDNIFSTFFIYPFQLLHNMFSLLASIIPQFFILFFVFLKNFPLISIYNFSSALFCLRIFFTSIIKHFHRIFYNIFLCIFTHSRAIFSVVCHQSRSRGNFQGSSWEATFLSLNKIFGLILLLLSFFILFGDIHAKFYIHTFF
jgi:hypothetical protein